jgi:enamine deaminase RidA (YjgF/YER057c/UK114 family)
MDIQRINSGPRLSEAVIHDGKVYLCGFVAENGVTVAEQTGDILAQIDATLKEAGTDKTKLLKVNIWLTDITTIGEMNKVWDTWAVAGKTPARATVEARLADPSWKIEVMVEAAL